MFAQATHISKQLAEQFWSKHVFNHPITVSNDCNVTVMKGTVPMIGVAAASCMHCVLKQSSKVARATQRLSEQSPLLWQMQPASVPQSVTPKRCCSSTTTLQHIYHHHHVTS
jgi:hypothetical protein